MCDYGWDGYNVGIELRERRRAFQMAKKKQDDIMSDVKTTKNDAGEEIAIPSEHTPKDERELTRRAEESANDPGATGQEYEETK